MDVPNSQCVLRQSCCLDKAKSQNQSRSQDFAKGGLFGKLESIVNKLDSNYYQCQIRVRRSFAQNQVISKEKKRSSPKFGAFFFPKIR